MRTQEQITREYQDTLKKAKALWGELLACVNAKPEIPQQFKVGDWVVCREQHYDKEFVSYMRDNVGKAVQIRSVDMNDFLTYFAGGWWYKAEWLSHATPDEIAAARKLQDGSSGCTITAVWG